MNARGLERLVAAVVGAFEGIEHGELLELLRVLRPQARTRAIARALERAERRGVIRRGQPGQEGVL
jgi:hypothetical protein